MLKLTNNASATLAGAITSAATSVVLTAGNGSLFPALGAGEFFYGTLVDSSNNLEVVKVTARTTDTLTVVRAQDGTVARAYSVGDKFELRLVAAVFSEMIQRDGSVDFTAQITVPQGTAAGKAINASRTVNTTAPLAGGGNLTGDLTLTHNTSGVTAGTKGSTTQIPVVTVDDKGHVTSLTGVALDLSTKVDLNGANATGTWGGTTEWSRVNNRPTALSQFSNDVGGGFFYATANCGYGNPNFGQGNTGNCRPMASYGVNGQVVSNCGNVSSTSPVIEDSGVTVNYKYYQWNYNCNCNCCCCC